MSLYRCRDAQESMYHLLQGFPLSLILSPSWPLPQAPERMAPGRSPHLVGWRLDGLFEASATVVAASSADVIFRSCCWAGMAGIHVCRVDCNLFLNGRICCSCNTACRCWLFVLCHSIVRYTAICQGHGKPSQGRLSCRSLVCSSFLLRLSIVSVGSRQLFFRLSQGGLMFWFRNHRVWSRGL